jgi:hypothetical protein
MRRGCESSRLPGQIRLSEEEYRSTQGGNAEFHQDNISGQSTRIIYLGQSPIEAKTLAATLKPPNKAVERMPRVEALGIWWV